jgi:hypothetical protein
MNLYDGWTAVAATFFLLVNTPFFLLFFSVFSLPFRLASLLCGIWALWAFGITVA